MQVNGCIVQLDRPSGTDSVPGQQTMVTLALEHGGTLTIPWEGSIPPGEWGGYSPFRITIEPVPMQTISGTAGDPVVLAYGALSPDEATITLPLTVPYRSPDQARAIPLRPEGRSPLAIFSVARFPSEMGAHTPALPAAGTAERAALETRYPIERWMDTGTYATFLGKMAAQEQEAMAVPTTPLLDSAVPIQVEDRTQPAPALFCLACAPGALDGFTDVSREAFLDIYDAGGRLVLGGTHLHPQHTSVIAYARNDPPGNPYTHFFPCPCGSGQLARHHVQGSFLLHRM